MVEYLCWSSTVTYILKRRKQISKKSILITVQEELEDGLPVSIPREGSSRLPDVCFKFDACSTGQHFNISKWAFFTLNLELLYEYVVNCFSCVWLFMTSWTPRVPPGYSVMEFSRQEYWSGLPCPPPGDLPYPGIKSASPALIGGFFFFTTSVTWEALICIWYPHFRGFHPRGHLLITWLWRSDEFVFLVLCGCNI